jgi:hypothetical protein
MDSIVLCKEIFGGKMGIGNGSLGIVDLSHMQVYYFYFLGKCRAICS